MGGCVRHDQELLQGLRDELIVKLQAHAWRCLLTCRSPVLGEYWLRRRCVWLCLLGRHVPKKRNYLQHWCATWSWKEALCLNDSCHPSLHLKDFERVGVNLFLVWSCFQPPGAVVLPSSSPLLANNTFTAACLYEATGRRWGSLQVIDTSALCDRSCLDKY